MDIARYRECQRRGIPTEFSGTIKAVGKPDSEVFSGKYLIVSTVTFPDGKPRYYFNVIRVKVHPVDPSYWAYEGETDCPESNDWGDCRSWIDQRLVEEGS